MSEGAAREAAPPRPSGERDAVEASAATQTPAAANATSNGALRAPRDAPIGGQAVLEGVMMRGVSTWSVAVRQPPKEGESGPGEIKLVSEPLVSVVKRHRVLRLPLVRGVAALVESLGIGFKALGISARAQVDDEDDGVEIGGGAWAGTVVVSIALAIAL